MCSAGRFCPLNFILRRCPTIAKEELQINEEIRDKEVRLIDEEGNQQGIVQLDVAFRMADEAGLDLVKIAPQATPPRMQDNGLRQVQV